MRWFYFLFAISPIVASATDYLSFGGGVFDLLRDKHRTGEFEAEYKFLVRALQSPYPELEFRPLVGVMSTVQGALYLYLGIDFDLLFFERIVFAPGFAAGWYRKGQGKDLGYPLEFRSGVELAWQFSDSSRLGVHFYHISNASIGRRNPGEESLVFYYDIPLTSSFPFNNKSIK